MQPTFSKSYPLLDISRRYSYPYEHVLCMADAIRCRPHTTWIEQALMWAEKNLSLGERQALHANISNVIAVADRGISAL